LQTLLSKYYTVLTTELHKLYRNAMNQNIVTGKNKSVCATENSSKTLILKFDLNILNI